MCIKSGNLLRQRKTLRYGTGILQSIRIEESVLSGGMLGSLMLAKAGWCFEEASKKIELTEHDKNPIFPFFPYLLK